MSVWFMLRMQAVTAISLNWLFTSFIDKAEGIVLSPLSICPYLMSAAAGFPPKELRGSNLPKIRIYPYLDSYTA